MGLKLLVYEAEGGLKLRPEGLSPSLGRPKAFRPPLGSSAFEGAPGEALRCVRDLKLLVCEALILRVFCAFEGAPGLAKQTYKKHTIIHRSSG